jgi:DNA-binding CsgD family transcriptional regulator
MSDLLTQARAAFDRQDWSAACQAFASADRDQPLEPDNIERLAVAATLLGRDTESTALWARAHQEFHSRHQNERAARAAFWLALGMLDRGESAQAAGWIARGRRLLESASPECVELGYLSFPDGFEAFARGDFAGALDIFRRVSDIGSRAGDRDLVAMARHGEGRARIRLGECAEGIRLLDEVMVSVTAGEVSPLVVGDVYCGVISGCQEVFDLRRAREWTAALHAWCGRQNGLVAYQAQCLVHRAEIMQLGGDWPNALAEAERACAFYARSPGQPGAGAACYQVGELHRLRGEWDQAEAAYRDASGHGRRPQPGMALLRLAQGEIPAAAAAIRGALENATATRQRAQLLPAYVEIMLAAGEAGAAQDGAAELAAIATTLDSPLLKGVAAQAQGAVHLRNGDDDAALPLLNDAVQTWRDLDVPHETARTRVLASIAYRRLGDRDAAELELDAAHRVLQQLGADAEIERIQSRFSRPSPPAAGGLTGREREVLALVAAGKTNRAIATQLGISEKTVARHLSNIFTKLDINSRAAATAYAYQHHLIGE